MSPRVQYASFLVRLWRFSDQSGPGIPVRWQSEVEHIQSGKMWTFNTLEELNAFLQSSQVVEGLAWIELQVTEPPGVHSNFREI